MIIAVAYQRGVISNERRDEEGIRRVKDLDGVKIMKRRRINKPQSKMRWNAWRVNISSAWRRNNERHRAHRQRAARGVTACTRAARKATRAARITRSLLS